MNKPNFLIVGAPKCGTTSLYDLLSQHKDIYLPKIKEPHYFGNDLTQIGFTGKFDKYLELFGETNASWRGEASTWYLYSNSAAKEIYDFNKDMKIIIMIRNPVFAAHSLHSQALYDLNEDVESFEEAVRLQDKRKKGEFIPDTNNRREVLFYTDVYSYGSQIQRYVKWFGKEQLKIILFEDFIKDPIRSVGEVLQFLNINESFNPKVEIKNKRKKPKWLAIQRILEKKDKKITKFIPLLFRKKVHYLLKSLNSKPKRKEEIPLYQKNKIYNILKDEIELTEKILDIKLHDWKYE